LSLNVLQPPRDQVSIVLAGNFNPAIIVPAWLAVNKLVGEEEAKAANINLIQADFAQFQVGEYAIAIQPDKFSVTCNYLYHALVRDLVLNIFNEHLSHTPLTALGINRHVHFVAKDFWTRDRMGRRLAPLEPWGNLGKQIQGSMTEPMKHGGLSNLSMKIMKSDEAQPGHIMIAVQPSAILDLRETGIFVLVNDHFELPRNSTPSDIGVVGTSQIMSYVEKFWEHSIIYAETAVKQLQALAVECEAEE
jgi:hypothetical protein